MIGSKLLGGAAAAGRLSTLSRRPRRALTGLGRQISVAVCAAEDALASDELGKELTGKALLIGWDPGPGERGDREPEWSPEESLEELKALCKAINIEVKDTVLQKWRPDRGTLPLGKGKIEEVREQVDVDTDIGLVIFDKDLNFKSLLKLKGTIDPDNKVTLLDRTSLILRIFAARARTKEAMLQVALARQQYMLPRLRFYMTTGAGMEARGGSAAGSSMGGSAGGALKGKGETQLNQDKFMLVKQMTHIKQQLAEVRKHRSMERDKRQDLGLPIVSLVGYTNAGKSTLLNTLCGKPEVTAKDRLFETLDATRRRVKLDGGREILMVDTVGFVQRLPTQLVQGFRATLEEVSEATMLLHVIDISSPTAGQQVSTVMRTLKSLPDFKIDTPQLLVYNKVDKLEGGMSPELEQSLSYPWPGVVGHCQISALNGFGLAALADAIEATLQEHTAFGAEKMQLLIPYAQSGDYAKLRGPPPMARVVKEEHTAEGYHVSVVATPEAARKLQKFKVQPNERPVAA